MKVGVIGLGMMGSGMALSLLRAGHEVTVYNRSAGKAGRLVAAGATEIRCLVDMTGVDAVITMLTDDAAEREVLFRAGLMDGLPPSTVHIASSTISTETAQMLAEAHRDRGRPFVGAPVSGRGDMAAVGQLFVLASGAAKDVRRLEPVFAAIGQRTFVFGERPDAAHAAKLCVNFMMAAAIETMGEAFGLVEHLGVEPRLFLDFFGSAMFAAPAFRIYGDIIARQDFLPANTPVTIGLKDVRLAREAADRAGFRMPLVTLLEEKLVSALGRGLGQHDWSVIAQRSAESARSVA